MIVTLTPNPSMDLTVTLSAPLVPGAVHRIATATSQAGGKGVNISRACVAAGVPTIAVLPARDEDPYVLDLAHASIRIHSVVPDGEVRTNLTITTPDGTTTKLNSPGATMSPRTREELARVLGDLAGAARWIVLAGSLPPGCPPQWYADLVVALRHSGSRVAVDTSEAPLQALAARLGSGAPDLMKPNDEELASLTGADPAVLHADPAATAAAARALVDEGVGAVLATMGSRGAVLVTSEGAWHATPPPTTVVSTVGAGDCSLFGYLLASLRGATPEERLAWAVAYGSAAAGLPGTTIPGPGQVRPELARVRELSLAARD
jgi:1-phosphofructokinase